ncbi:MAG: hypothetical protein R2832_07875 [Rhodothermales bacterium]
MSRLSPRSRSLVLLAFAAACVSQPAFSQRSHEFVVAELVARCLLSTPQGTDTLTITRPPNLALLDAGVLSTLRDSLARPIRLALGEPNLDGPLLSYRLEQAHVRLRRNGRRIDREVSVAVPFVDIGNSGTVRDSGTCILSATDRIEREYAASLASASGLPSLVVDPVPSRGALRRFIGPAVTVGAATVSLYLLFNLRSDRQNASQ